MRARGAAARSAGAAPAPRRAPRLVCKLGGSLLDGGWAPPLLDVLRRAAPGAGILLLAGGGRSADRVRAAWRRGALGLSEAHWAAIRALDANALRLAGGCGAPLPLVTAPELPPVPAAADGAAGAASPPDAPAVLAPGPLLRAEDPLPHRWDVTSDSIAAWAAVRAGAGDVLLLKARGRRVARAAGSGPEPEGPGRETAGRRAARAAAEGLVDGHLPALLRDAALRAWIVNGRYPGRLLAFLTGDRTAAFRLLP